LLCRACYGALLLDCSFVTVHNKAQVHLYAILSRGRSMRCIN